MIIKRFALRIIGLVLTLSIAVIGFVRLDFSSILGNAVCLSVAASAPEGLFGFFKADTAEGSNGAELDTAVTEIITSGNSDGTDDAVTSVAVTETVIGNIIKKTLTPYNANTRYGKVYINNSSGAELDIAADLNSQLSFKVTKSDEPQILIYHTHATESFMESESEYLMNTDEPRSDDTEKNIVKIGEIIANRLNAAGYTCLHDKTLHDGPAYSGSYGRSASTVKEYLAKYPSIKIVIDVHRDSVTSGKSDKIAPIVEVNGKEAAQVMLVMGSQTGSVTDYPDWRENIKLAVKLQAVFEEKYPQLARAMLLRSSKYNQNLLKGAFLIEIGSDANTFEQAKYSAELTADSLITLLKQQ